MYRLYLKVGVTSSIIKFNKHPTVKFYIYVLGFDCMGCSKTGTGKTAAFALPILQKLSEDPYGIFCLVLTPTRELAYQISEQFSLLGQPINVRHTVIVGGMGVYLINMIVDVRFLQLINS